MTLPQKQICRELLSLSYESGFCSYPLKPIAEKLGITEPLYNEDAETGVLWPLGPYGNGLLYISGNGEHAGVSMGMKELCEHWSDYR